MDDDGYEMHCNGCGEDFTSDEQQCPYCGSQDVGITDDDW